LAIGDMVQGYAYRKGTRTLKTTTGCTKGYVLAYDTDGYSHATQALRTAAPTYPFVVADETVTAPGSGQSEADVIEEGVVELAKVTGAIGKDQLVGISTTAGKVTAWTAPDAPSTYGEATVQAELDKFLYVIGRAHAAAASGDTTVKVRLKGVH